MNRMSQLKFSISFFLSLISWQQAQAFPFHPKLPKVPANALQDQKMQSDAPTTCVNFSGKWKGVCVSDDGDEVTREDAQMEIVQNGCAELGVDGTMVKFGGQMSDRFEDSEGAGSYSIFIDWNADHTEVINHASVAYRDLNKPTYVNSNGVGRMFLRQGKLITQEKTTNQWETYGQSGTTVITDECTYTKEP